MAERVNVTPAGCLPPHRVTRPEQREVLQGQFMAFGWAQDAPKLVGYRLPSGKIQLLSGSHRWAAAQAVGLALPVVVWSEAEVRDAWGDLERWERIMRSGDV